MTEEQFCDAIRAAAGVISYSRMQALVLEGSMEDGCTSASLMPFGKWTGRPMSKVPASYLLWLAREMGPEPDGAHKKAIAAYIDRNRESLQNEADRYEREKKS